MSLVEQAEKLGHAPEIKLLRETRPEEIAQRTSGKMTYGKYGRSLRSKTPWSVVYPDAEILWAGFPTKEYQDVLEAVPFLINKQNHCGGTLLASAIVLYPNYVLIVDPGPDKPSQYGDPSIISGHSISADGNVRQFEIPTKKADKVLLQARNLARSNNPYNLSRQ